MRSDVRLGLLCVSLVILLIPSPTQAQGDVVIENYIFKSGPDPLPDRSAADVNCSGGISGADILWMANHIFKAGPEPCPWIIKRI